MERSAGHTCGPYYCLYGDAVDFREGLREGDVRLGDSRSAGVAVCGGGGNFRDAGGGGNGVSVAVRGDSVAIRESFIAIHEIGVEGDGTRGDGCGWVIGPCGG